jgi:hypothetical protein
MGVHVGMYLSVCMHHLAGFWRRLAPPHEVAAVTHDLGLLDLVCW